MDFVLDIIHLALAVLLVALILIQSKGAGLSAAFGGGGGNVYTARRGAEQVLFRGTIVIAVLFFGLALARLFI